MSEAAAKPNASEKDLIDTARRLLLDKIIAGLQAEDPKASFLNVASQVLDRLGGLEPSRHSQPLDPRVRAAIPKFDDADRKAFDEAGPEFND